jgi:hypothetical protein
MREGSRDWASLSEGALWGVVRYFRRSCAQAGMFTRVPLSPPTAVRPPHRTENEACYVWKNASVKQPSVRSLPFTTKRFFVVVKKKKNFCGSNRACALALNFYTATMVTRTRPKVTLFAHYLSC